MRPKRAEIAYILGFGERTTLHSPHIVRVRRCVRVRFTHLAPACVFAYVTCSYKRNIQGHDQDTLQPTRKDC